MTRYKKNTQKNYVKKDKKKKIKKYGNGNVFLNLMKTVANLFGKTS